MPERPILVKCLVWDLDNTLWQGTLLEDPEVGLSDDIRNVIVELDSRGILNSIASKNDFDLAYSRLEELGLAEYFVLPTIGWGPKSTAVRDIADQLNFAHSAIAFIDDQPAERAEVAYRAPDVRCYRAEQALSLVELPEFIPEKVTVDARRRREMYQARFRREAEQAAYSGPDDEFLRSLRLELDIDQADEAELSRVEELTLRTSQMNATGVHYSYDALLRLLADPNHRVLVASLTDRFGPHGAIGVVLLERHSTVWHLKLLATSCRVVSFGVGATLLSWLTDQAHQAGVHVVADFRSTDRNRIMEVAYRFAGFAVEACECAAPLVATVEDEGIQRMHLFPTPQKSSSVLQLRTVDLIADVPRPTETG